MTKQLGVVMDPIENIKPSKDTSLALLLEAKRRGFVIHYFEIQDLFLKGGQVFANTHVLDVFDDEQKWFTKEKSQTIKLSELDLILIRNEPPFDENFLYLTHLLDLVEKQGVRIINKPQAIRDVNEKIFTAWFPECCPPTLVGSQKSLFHDFLQEHKDIILKPLNGMGGQGVFRVKLDDANFGAILETLTNNEQTAIMAQRYIHEIKQGDKRISMIDGKPIPYALARIPADGETRANLAKGGKGVAQALTENDKKICERVGETLKQKGLYFVGLDVIGDYLTEINVTSPTCTREIETQTAFKVIETFFDNL
jgi:glutathione synthase